MIECEPGHFALGDSAFASIERNGVPVIPEGVAVEFHGFPSPAGGGLNVGGHFVVECWDKDGNLKWEDTAENLVTTAGIASLLTVYFEAATQITAWYIGLVDNSGFTAFAAGDTMSSHAGWSEVAGSNFSNASRPAWSPGSVSGGAIVNGTTTNYNMTNSGSLTVYGLFLVSDSTKAGTTGTLFSTAAFTGGTQAVSNGDTLKVTYTMSATSS